MRRAFGFLTIFGSAAPPGPTTLRWFPVVGATVGLIVGAVWWGAGRLSTPLVAAVVAVIADLVLTGMLHVDGLADSADGLLPPVSRARRLEIMAKPDVGAFGVAVVAMVLLARVAGLASAQPSVLLIAGLWCAARTLMAAAVTVQPYARGEGGLASAFVPAGAEIGALGGYGPLVAGEIAALALAIAGAGAGGAAAVLSALVAGAAVLALSQRRVGGYTGDVLGAAGMVAESAGILAAGVRWP